jgi:hypothetical protein
VPRGIRAGLRVHRCCGWRCVRRSRAGWPREAPTGRSRRRRTGLVVDLASARETQGDGEKPTAVNTARGWPWPVSRHFGPLPMRVLVASYLIQPPWAGRHNGNRPPVCRKAPGHPDPVSPKADARCRWRTWLGRRGRGDVRDRHQAFGQVGELCFLGEARGTPDGQDHPSRAATRPSYRWPTTTRTPCHWTGSSSSGESAT